ncbi:MAG: sodium/solute symporter [Cytophagales bacterium]|nr:sodium/solute symporter [Cytophagales bacterium]
MNFTVLDYIIFGIYLALVLLIGVFSVFSKKNNGHVNAEEYFLANKSLTWWVIGASLIATNISATQFLGSNGSGYAIGLGIATYEWTAAIVLIAVGMFFLPVFIEKGIYTLPQFLEIRFNKNLRTVVALMYLLIFLFMDMPTALYLGALALKSVAGFDFYYAIAGLAIFTILYTVSGGLESVAWTDVLQTIVLIAGGAIVLIAGLYALGDGQGILSGIYNMYQKAPSHFDMILDSSNPNYQYLPGLHVLLGAVWIAHLNYWACNQYIIQKALAAKSIGEAQKGVLFAGGIKLFLPLILVLPGIIAYALGARLYKPDEAYPWLISQYLAPGIKGFAVAGLVAAIVSTLAAISNAISTLLVLDITATYYPGMSDVQKVKWGRIIMIASFIIALLVAPAFNSISQIFQFTQEFGGFYTPGTVALFLFGLFWSRTTDRAAMASVVLTIPLSVLFKIWLPHVPFINRMGIVFVILCAMIVCFSLLQNNGEHPKAIRFQKHYFKLSPIFIAGSMVIFAVLAYLYYIFW